MGEPKQLLAWRGRPLVAHAVAEALASRCRRVFVVLGANAAKVRAALAGLEAEEVVNAEWERGLASSIRRGVRAARDAETRDDVHWDALLLALADQPDVSSAVLDALIRRFPAADENAIVACAYAGVAGVPALFGRAHFDALSALEGDVGAKRLLDAHADTVLHVAFEAGRLDVDTPSDYQALLARPKRRGD
jgi:molybdenum cofactor cytidylyltransferase